MTDVLTSRDDAVLTVTLNRPEKLNALTAGVHAGLHEALADAADDEIRAVVITGAGRGFCVGQDLTEFRSAGGDIAAHLRATYHPTIHAIRGLDKPVIAAVNGVCAGAGLSLAAACDLRIASETARFNSAFLDVGVAGDMGGPWTLPRILGAAKARELYFLPGKFDAAEALRIGLVSKLSAADAFEADLEALAQRLARAAPLALAAMKANFVAAEKMSFSDYIALESEKHVRLFQSEDTTEAFRAFVEKRPPVFHGR
jgi:2-(1,2-epoxy-1,2-dihydrophenyl)acetyl-CoA isomerase